ncbi:MAG: DNA sulfur modification protein DndD [Deltaproteobacteria bacterium]|nr:DNA sulfur modification protein DndD [Deltaproteobacteria bacterium]TLN04363.1 MAG: DNA sulfur modification protein DndD [bacterium]
MIFNKLTVTNLGNFSGTYVLPLRAKDTQEIRPIILFGGLNGAGKTTLFDAIKLCLYGPEMFGAIGVAKYQEYLRRKIHSSKITVVQPNNASIAVEFDYAQLGTVNTYQIERMWEISGTKVLETLIIEKNGLPLNDIEKDGWQDFIKEIIPLGLSQLFFFDGEKIQRMMSDDSNEELKRSILSLLGLDLVERLQADLKIYRSKFLKGLSSENFAREISVLEGLKEELEAKIRRVRDDRAGLENLIQQFTNRIAEYRNKIAAQGEGYYRNRVNLEEKKSSLTYEIDSIKDKLRELAAGSLPLAIASSYALKLKKQIEDEGKNKADTLLSENLKKKHREMLSIIDSSGFLKMDGLNSGTLKKIKSQLKTEIEMLFSVETKQERQPEIFGYSQKQSLEILGLIDKAINVIPSEMAVLTDMYESKYRELQNVIAQLSKVPDEEFIKPMYETLEGLNVEFGGLTEKRDNLDAQIAELSSARSELERKIEQINEKIAKSSELDEKLQNVLKVERVLSKYHLHLAKQKILSLQEEVTHIFKLVHRKDDMIARILIDPETFNVTLYDRKDKVINKSSLSSGELEIYAMSMLWALAKTSGQKLPFIVDTPLARLDSKHRDNLVELFFPHASHQMMIFSTNTEVDQQYFNRLRPHVAHAYNLEYCEESKSTVVKEGYFWN